MGFVINVVFIIAAIVLLAIAGGFATDAARRVTTIPNWESNAELKSAHSYLTGAAVATWISIPLVIVLLILYFVYGSESIEITGNAVTFIFLLFILAMVILIGILAAIGASKINQANVSNNEGSYRQAIIAASLALGVMGIIIIILISRAIYRAKYKKEKEENTSLLSYVPTDINPTQLLKYIPE